MEGDKTCSIMAKLKIGVIDLVSKGPNNTLWARIMHANLASIMPTVVASWCEQEGHDVSMICYTGSEELNNDLPQDVDVVFICSFTQAALLAYALSNYFRKKGVVTVLGGPHARCYPDDSIKYFDYVLGFTDRSTIVEVLRNVVPMKKREYFFRQVSSLCNCRALSSGGSSLNPH